MFGAEYSRTKFWLVSIFTILIGSFLIGALGSAKGAETLSSLLSLLVLSILINTLANRIRAFGGEPWLALLAIIPFVGMFQAFYYGCKKSKNLNPSG